MSWITMLYNTYENVTKGDTENLNPPLLPVAHSTQNAQITVTIYKTGEFVSAETVSKADAKTLIPVTEDSSSRTSGTAPHPLNDKLEYVAGDYVKYTNSKDSNKNNLYLNELKKWCESEFSNKKAFAVFKYVEKGCLIKDLVNVKVLYLGNDNKLLDKWNGSKTDIPEIFKISQEKQEKAFIRFRVLGTEDSVSAVWQDKKLQQDYINYYSSIQGEKEFCYISGELTPCPDKHPKKIRNTGDGGKLISANDTYGFTYRGRFSEPDQVVRVGFDVSQKAHNALKWLIEKQGKVFGTKVFLLWGTRNEIIPDPLIDTDEFYSDYKDTGYLLNTEQALAEKFNLALSGYKAELKSDTELVLMVIDSATTGRLSINFYREYNGLQSNELINRIANWHLSCKWHHRFKKETTDKKEKKTIHFYGAPSTRDIALAVLGTEQNGFLKADDKLVANLTERLLPCISDGAKIPLDIVRASINRVFHPQNYKEKYNWEKVLSITCALVCKMKLDYEGEVWDLSLNNKTESISYNCGRLLAIADAIESWALKDSGMDRPTTAMRLFSRFSQYPCNTWNHINRNLVVYKNKLGKKGKKLYDMLSEISSKIDPEAFKNERNLDGLMILGFDSQRHEIFKKEEEK